MDARTNSANYDGRQSAISDRLERRLVEAWQGLWDHFVDPREAFWDDGPEWVATGSLPGSPFAKTPFINEMQLREIRDECRVLAVSNEFAINGHENRISYLVGSGHTYRATAKKGRDVSPEVWQTAQRVLDDFICANQWHRRQQEIVCAATIATAEVFLRFFTSRDGTTRIRFVEPGQVDDAGRSSRRSIDQFRHSHRGSTTSKRRWPITSTAWQLMPARFQHRKANVDYNVKRGLPLYYPVRKNLRRAEKAAAQHERGGGDSIGHRADSQASQRHAHRRAAVRRRARPT